MKIIFHVIIIITLLQFNGKQETKKSLVHSILEQYDLK